jgi:hypothetical protein
MIRRAALLIALPVAVLFCLAPILKTATLAIGVADFLQDPSLAFRGPCLHPVAYDGDLTPYTRSDGICVMPVLPCRGLGPCYPDLVPDRYTRYGQPFDPSTDSLFDSPPFIYELQSWLDSTVRFIFPYPQFFK